MRVLLIGVVSLLPSLARADDAALYRRCVDGVVRVVCTAAEGEVAYGTGVVALADGGIVTAHHVIDGAKTIEVIFPVRDGKGAVRGDASYYDGRRKRCRVTGVSPDCDLALLRLVEPTERLHVIELASSGGSPGESVFSIGAGSEPAPWHYISGAVRQSYEGGFSADDGMDVKCRIIETSIPINAGDSGSPILRDGKLVGMNLATDPDSNQVHLGVDVSEIRNFLSEAIAVERVLARWFLAKRLVAGVKEWLGSGHAPSEGTVREPVHPVQPRGSRQTRSRLSAGRRRGRVLSERGTPCGFTFFQPLCARCSGGQKRLYHTIHNSRKGRLFREQHSG